MNMFSQALLLNYIRASVSNIYDLQGMLDSQFAQIQVLQDASNPNFVMDVITIFCNDAERIMLELNNYL
jgi:histidine-containing phosphotransfer protein